MVPMNTILPRMSTNAAPDTARNSTTNSAEEQYIVDIQPLDSSGSSCPRDEEPEEALEVDAEEA
jgi:hypothetical protein